MYAGDEIHRGEGARGAVAVVDVRLSRCATAAVSDGDVGDGVAVELPDHHRDRLAGHAEAYRCAEGAGTIALEHRRRIEEARPADDIIVVAVIVEIIDGVGAKLGYHSK